MIIKNIILKFGKFFLFVIITFLFLKCNHNSDFPKFKKLSKAEIQYYFAELEFRKTRDPLTGEIPFDIRNKELEFVKSIPSREEYLLKNILKSEKNNYPIILSQDWSSAGPNNVAGRMKDICFDVKDNNIILAASASGGIWRSTDYAESWVKTSDAGAEQSIYCIEQDKRNDKSDVWYYGTGELLSTTDRKFTKINRTVGMGNGIYKSTDNGLSWFPLLSTISQNKSGLPEVFQAVWDIKVDNSNETKDIVYAACTGGILVSEDGGNSWNLSLGDLTNRCFSSDIEFNSDYSMMYAALSSMTTNNKKPLKSGIYRSKDGKNWIDITPQEFPELTRVIKLVSAPSNPNVLYVLTEKPVTIADPFLGFAASHHTLWKYTYYPSDNRGIWEERTNNLPFQDTSDMNKVLNLGFNSLGGYCFTFNVKPDDENVLFLGGTNLYRSTNAFADTFQITKIGGYNTYQHPDNHAIEFLPTNSNVIFNASDGGITITNNCLATYVSWIEKNNGLRTTQFYSVAFNQTGIGDNILIGGLQDQGTVMKLFPGSNNWTRIFGGDGLSCYISNNREFAIVSVYQNQIYGARFTNDAQLSISYNNYLYSNEIYNLTQNFFTIFDVEPNNNNELYLVVDNVIYRKTNLKNAIGNSNLSNRDWTRLINTVMPDGVNISALRISSKPANRLFFGTDNGKVYRVDNCNTGNPSKLDITGDNFPIGAYVSCITVDPNDADKIFVVFSNYNVQSIFYTTNGGGNWTVQGGNLEENPDGGGAGPSIRWLEILHRDDGSIYLVGTTSGLYSTTNLTGVNTVWVKESPESIGNIRIDMISARQADGFVAVATQGNGMFTCKIDNVNPVINDENNILKISNYPNPCDNKTEFEFNLPNMTEAELILYNQNGQIVGIIKQGFFNAGKHKIEYSTRNLSSGIYYYVLKSRNILITGKMIIKH